MNGRCFHCLVLSQRVGKTVPALFLIFLGVVLLGGFGAGGSGASVFVAFNLIQRAVDAYSLDFMMQLPTMLSTFFPGKFLHALDDTLLTFSVEFLQQALDFFP